MLTGARQTGKTTLHPISARLRGSSSSASECAVVHSIRAAARCAVAHSAVCSSDNCRPKKSSVQVDVNTACGPNDCCTGGLFDVDVVPSPRSVDQIQWYDGTVPRSVTHIVDDAQIARDGWRFESIDVVCTDTEETVAFYDYNAVCSDCAVNPN